MPEVEDKDHWRQLYQALPRGIYDRLFLQLQRVARANGIAPSSMMADSKFKAETGPRVMAWECLLVLLERTEDESVFRV